jgi:hypothetical protein
MKKNATGMGRTYDLLSDLRSDTLLSSSSPFLFLPGLEPETFSVLD